MYPTVVNTTYTSGAMESTMHGKVGVLRVVAVSLEAAVEKKSRLRCWYRPHNPGLPPPPSGGERGETFYSKCHQCHEMWLAPLIAGLLLI